MVGCGVSPGCFLRHSSLCVIQATTSLQALSTLAPPERHVEIDVEDPRRDPLEVGTPSERQPVGPLQSFGRPVVSVEAIHRREEVAAIERHGPHSSIRSADSSPVRSLPDSSDKPGTQTVAGEARLRTVHRHISGCP